MLVWRNNKEEKYTFIDFDGVILDSEERMLERKYDAGFHNHKDGKEYDKYFEYTNMHPEEWDYIIREASSINDSVEIIRELEHLKRRIAILTKIHSLYEMRVKIEDLRNNRKINSPVIFVPPGVSKHDVVLPNGQLLIDDSKRNIHGWIDNGGVGFIFDKTLSEDTNDKVKSLEFLLRK